MSEGNVDQVLVPRVLRLYNPWRHLNIESGGFARTMQDYPIQSTYLDGFQRTDDYDYGRVRHLMDEMQVGKEPEPIELDNSWMGTTPTGLLVVDGHHRLMAAALLKRRFIPALYSGWTDVLDWLKGQRKSCPFDPPFDRLPLLRGLD